MATSGQEKTEEPTGKKLEDTRKKGQAATLSINFFCFLQKMAFLGVGMVW
mgnify:CR=1 FL=1